MRFLQKTAWLGCLLLLCLGQAQAAAKPADDDKAALALLEKALAYYHDNGDKAFAAFSRQGEFVDKDRYVFVLDTKGVMLASGGPSAALIGRDVSDVLGPDLQKAFKDALKVPEGNGIQQAEYRWQNWSDGKVERKHVYYQRVGQRILAVGYYLPRASAEQAMALLLACAKSVVDLNTRMHAGHWDKATHKSIELHGRTSIRVSMPLRSGARVVSLARSRNQGLARPRAIGLARVRSELMRMAYFAAKVIATGFPTGNGAATCFRAGVPIQHL